MILTRKQSAT